MAVSRGGDAVIAAGPTELRRYLPVSLIATGVVAGIPLWLVFGLGEHLGLVATLLSVAASFALAHVGAIAWTRWPGSRDVVFNDLMLWGFARRIVTQHRLIRRVERLGFSTTDDPDEMTLEERTELLKKLAAGLEAGDPYTHGHSQRVARHAYMVAKSMKLPRREAEKIRLAGVIHDVGKLRIPREIITKPGRLTDEEFDVIKRHTVDGAAMVEVLGDPEVTDMVRHHHERLDGSGYPDNLAGDEISMGARVLAVADTFDAASSLRPYRAAQKHKVALDILTEEARAGRLDPAVVDAFISYYSGRKSLKWWAFLSSGPAHLFDVPFVFVQRVGATGLANAAVVGAAAIALAPGSPLQGRVVDGDAARKDRVVVSNGSQLKDGDAADFGSGSAANGSSGSKARSNDGSRDGRKTSKGRASQKERHEKNKGGNQGARGNKGAAAETGRKDDARDEGRENPPTKDDETGGGAVAGAVDTTTEGATASVSGPAKNANGTEDSTSTNPDSTTETVSDAVGSPAVAPGNPDGQGKDKK